METDTPTPKRKEVKEGIILIATILIFTVIALLFLRNHAEKEGKELMQPMDEVSRLHAEEGYKNCVNLDKEQTASLLRLNNALQQYKQQHEITFLKLYKYHFTSSTLFLVFSILSALALFLITQEGWKNTSNIVRILFLTCTAFASFFGLSLSTFEQKISIDQNANAYIDYDNLQKRLRNYCATSMTTDAEFITFDQMHSEIVKEAETLHGFYLEFDTESVNAATIFSLDAKNKAEKEAEKEKEGKDPKKDEKNPNG